MIDQPMFKFRINISFSNIPEIYYFQKLIILLHAFATNTLHFFQLKGKLSSAAGQKIKQNKNNNQ
jgi:hypothetical protein